MAYYSPMGSTPGQQEYYFETRYASPSPTPSPRAGAYYYPERQTPVRPATRAHTRGASSGAFEYGGNPRTPAFSPRYTSTGHYATATANVSSSRSSRPPQRRNGHGDHPNHPSSRPSRRERRHSTSYPRTPDPYGESDEDEFIEYNGFIHVLPARSRAAKRYPTYHHDYSYGGYETDDRYYPQTPVNPRQPFVEREYTTPRYEKDPIPDRRPTAAPGHGHGHARRASAAANIQRPSTVKPTSRQASAATPKKPVQKPVQQPRKATLEDAKLHRIPDGYQLKNWDPSEHPIMLLGSVFDSNSLGKWIYDWTVYRYNGDGYHPMVELAGELWVLLISLYGKIKRAEDTMSQIRSEDNKEIVDDFIESGERLTDKLRKLLKACETAMLKIPAKKVKDNMLGTNAGVEFVNTLWGRERELEKTERFMASVRLWDLRFDANCEEILKKPTM